jgi:predicted negative regulator of RcsB-dependent stress response
MTDEEKEEWSHNQFQRAIQHFRRALQNIPQNLSETKCKIQTELAGVLCQTKEFDEALQIYEDGFYVSCLHFNLLISHRQEELS